MQRERYRLAFRTRVHLNDKQQRALLHWANARRYAYNWALRACLLLKEYAPDHKLPLSRLGDIDKWFNAGKYPLGFIRKQKGAPLRGTGEHVWLRETGVPSSVCQLAIKQDLKAAWQRCFKGISGAPRFQARNRRTSFKLSTADLKCAQISKRHITLPKGLGKARLGDCPDWLFEAKLMNTAFSREGNGKWYVAFTLEVPEDIYRRHGQQTERAVGMDLGVVQYAALSDGTCKPYPKEALTQLRQRIGSLQRKLNACRIRGARLVMAECPSCREKSLSGMNEIRTLCINCRQQLRKPSRKQKTLLRRIAKLQAKQKQIRENTAHQLTSELVKDYQLIAVEDLKVKNMTKSARGTQQAPGSRVKQKSGLNRELLNMSPYRVRAQLQYKADRYERTLVLVDPKNTSRTCYACKHTAQENRRSQAEFVCQQCGHENNADINAAQNILQRALDLLEDESSTL